MPTEFPRRGEVWSVAFPDESKLRPALIVSPDARNQFANSVLAIPLTTNLRPLATHVLLPGRQGGLAHDSMARCENMTLIHKSRMRRGGFAGTVSPALIREIERALMLALGINA